MFIIKKKYYLYIENTSDINLKCIKKSKKIFIIYRNKSIKENIDKLYKFKKLCTERGFKFYIANDLRLLKACKGDGLYLSSFNKKISLDKRINLIGSAHCFKEINEKIKQGCKTILLSRLFKTYYENKKDFFGLIKFNLIIKNYKISIIPLGGIRASNLNKLNLVNSSGLALLSEVKKKPAITNRLF
jgi:thiamine monophosphate synthase